MISVYSDDRLICIFLCWEWGRWVVYLVSVYLVYFVFGR
nr:MAG TPA: envelope glycoprotein [Caudoviricetes sp.]